MKTEDVVNGQETPGASLYGQYLLALGVSLIGNLLVRIAAEGGWLPPAGRAVVAVLTALPLAVAAVMFRRLLRRDLDEMVQRVVLEGLAFAFVVYVPIAALYVNLRAAGVWVPRLDPPDILLAPALLAAIGIMLAWRRLR
jgi:hypothetical protein